MKKLALAVISMLVSVSALAHSGGLDKKGCHRDNKNGGSHCH